MARTRELMAQLGVDASAVKTVADLGCATGLSSLALLRAFPGAAVTGVDLSPHFLAVARYEQRERAAAAAQAASGSGPNAAAAAAAAAPAAEPLTFVHAAAEDTKLPAGSFDLVGMCLVAHELPGEATRAVLREAYRLLKPGGVMSIMEMNPQSPAFQRIFNNPIAFAAFKSTEPHLASYMALDLADAYVSAGFEAPLQAENTPRHRTVVGRKPLSAA
jgi:ubiquinone/menaquinone biosynthesis C-methylase UbiE